MLNICPRIMTKVLQILLFFRAVKFFFNEIFYTFTLRCFDRVPGWLDRVQN